MNNLEALPIPDIFKPKQSQQFLQEMLRAFDRLPGKRLIASKYQDAQGDVCALGALASFRGLDLATVNANCCSECPSTLFNISHELTRLIVAENDYPSSKNIDISPENRFKHMKKWIRKRLVEATKP